ncbi:MAG: hypothetical protein V3U76_16960 [Granulosicoccus sp.]
MAGMIREANDLATIRVSLDSSKNELDVVLKSMVGAETLAMVVVPAAILGIQDSLTAKTYRSTPFNIPKDIVQKLTDPLVSVLQPHNPVWLQLDASTGHLAVVPWERLLQPSLQAPLLRIPNFLADPIYASKNICVVLIASAPRAKGSPDFRSILVELVGQLQRRFEHRVTVHVFVDRDSYDSVEARFIRDDSVLVAEPPPHDESNVDELNLEIQTKKVTGSARSISSPWLAWVRKVTRHTSVDLVHFICPGYFHGNQAALALAETPGVNENNNWSHFIAANEVVKFLDLVGAWALGLSAPRDDVWAIGLRLLADRLAWQRPGPLFLHDACNESSEVVGELYQFLFDATNQQPIPPASSGLMFYTHPKRLRGMAGDSGAFDRTFSTQTGERSRGITVDRSDQLNRMTEKAGRVASASLENVSSPWQRSNRMQLDRIIGNTYVGNQTPSSGTLKGLTFLDDLYKQASKDSLASPPVMQNRPDEGELES